MISKIKNIEKKILAYALKNAIEHEGEARAEPILNSLFHEGLEKTEVKDIIKDIRKTVKEVNSLYLEEQKKKFQEIEKEISKRKEREGLQELPNVKGKVVMRFAPFPSGSLHIGNARTLLLNDEYVKMYGGELFLVIDDTIGSEEKQILPEAYSLIEEGIKLLNVNYNRLIKKSDRLEIYYDYAKKLIEKGKAYVCSCPAEKLRENRKLGKECSCRNNSVEKNLELWKKMFDKKTKEGELTLRIKTSMKDKNPAFRDRVLFRICEREHPLTKNKYRVWPLLDFSWAIDDYLLGITHIVRGKELMIETDMEKYIFDIFGWKKPEFIHMGLLHFEGVKLSKSKGQREVKEGRYFGWHDPRTWSIQSLIKRGIQPEALRKFIIELGIRQNEITAPVDILYAENRKILHGKSKQAKFEENKKGNTEIIMPDGSVVNGSSNVKPKKQEIVHFIKFGYCKFDESKGKKFIFYFAHK